MRVGIAFDLRFTENSYSGSPSHILEGNLDPLLPEDAFEEMDSIETVEAIESILHRAGHETLRLGSGKGFVVSVLENPVDIVFNIAEGWGTRSREAHVPSVLEMLGIPYTGSDPLTLALTLDKGMAKRVVMSAGVLTPRFMILKSLEDFNSDLSFPLILKPAWEGSSIGIRRNSKVENIKEFVEKFEWLIDSYREPCLVEEFIQGEEVTVGVMGNESPRVIGMMMIQPRNGSFRDFIYSLEVKRNWREEVNYICPPPISGPTLNELRRSALAAYEALTCRDVARLDFRIGKDGMPYFLEANPLPGLNPETGDLPIMVQKEGMPYEELILSILNHAIRRHGFGAKGRACI
ncbi:MAG: D-alanine--D-alanine ligase [Candidatus Dadabacteria bacterium]